MKTLAFVSLSFGLTAAAVVPSTYAAGCSDLVTTERVLSATPQPAAAGSIAFGPKDVPTFDGPGFGPKDVPTFDGPGFGPKDVPTFDGPGRVPSDTRPMGRVRVA